MAQRTPLLLRVSVVASSLLLVTGLIGHKTGYLFSRVESKPERSHSSLDLNSIDTAPPQSKTYIWKAQANSDGMPDIIRSDPDKKSINITPVSQTKSFDKVSKKAIAPADPEVVQGTIPLGVPRLTVEQVAALRRSPGKTSLVLIEYDAYSKHYSLIQDSIVSTKSVVLISKIPEDHRKAIDTYLTAVHERFAKLDKDHDRKLTLADLGEHNWKHFQSMGAIENGTVDFDGFLKNYPWYIEQK